MHKVSYAFLALPLMLLGSFAQAQTAGTINFTANQTSATGSLVPVLTWSTTPVASSCTASGAWSGTKFASGSETLASITTSKSYTLTCTWGNGTATINWTAPTTNTDGSALTDLARFKVLYGSSATALNMSQEVNSASARSATVAALASGTWHFAVRAVNNSGTESDNSNVTQKTITAASAAKTVNITITPVTTPPPTPTPTLKTTSTRVYDVLWQNGVRVQGQQVGTIAIGKRCDSTYKVGTNRYRVTRSDVTITVTPRSNSLVARCAIS
jgi:hypothetical protein